MKEFGPGGVPGAPLDPSMIYALKIREVSFQTASHPHYVKTFISIQEKFQGSSPLPNIKYNCAVSFLSQYCISYLFILPNIFSHRP